MSETLSLREAADFLGVSYRTVRRYVKKGLPYVEVRGDRGIEYRVRHDDLEVFRLAEEGSGEPSIDATMNRAEEKRSPIKTNTASQETDNQPPRSLDAEASRGLMQQLLELYEADISFLREQIRVKDEQLAMKDRQMSSFQETFSRLTHQNEVLTMIAQGIEPKKLLRNTNEEEMLFSRPFADTCSEEEAEESVLSDKKPSLSRDEIVAEMKKMFKDGKSQWEIKDFIKKYGYNSVGEFLAK